MVVRPNPSEPNKLLDLLLHSLCIAALALWDRVDEDAGAGAGAGTGEAVEAVEATRVVPRGNEWTLKGAGVLARGTGAGLCRWDGEELGPGVRALVARTCVGAAASAEAVGLGAAAEARTEPVLEPPGA